MATLEDSEAVLSEPFDDASAPSTRDKAFSLHLQ